MNEIIPADLLIRIDCTLHYSAVFNVNRQIELLF